MKRYLPFLPLMTSRAGHIPRDLAEAKEIIKAQTPFLVQRIKDPEFTEAEIRNSIDEIEDIALIEAWQAKSGAVLEVSDVNLVRDLSHTDLSQIDLSDLQMPFPIIEFRFDEACIPFNKIPLGPAIVADLRSPLVPQILRNSFHIYPSDSIAFSPVLLGKEIPIYHAMYVRPDRPWLPRTWEAEIENIDSDNQQFLEIIRQRAKEINEPPLTEEDEKRLIRWHESNRMQKTYESLSANPKKLPEGISPEFYTALCGVHVTWHTIFALLLYLQSVDRSKAMQPLMNVSDRKTWGQVTRMSTVQRCRYRIIDITEKHNGSSSPSTGSHASPHLHWRKGHMRALRHERFERNADGSTRIVWVRPCLVGAVSDDDTTQAIRRLGPHFDDMPNS